MSSVESELSEVLQKLEVENAEVIIPVYKQKIREGRNV